MPPHQHITGKSSLKTNEPAGADDSVRPMSRPGFVGLSSLRRPYLFRLAGKDREEKGRLAAFGAFCVYNLGKYQFLWLLRTPQVTLRALHYAPPVTVQQD